MLPSAHAYRLKTLAVLSGTAIVRPFPAFRITFTESLVTFLGGTTAPRFIAPGTGDWSIYPSAAVYLEGTEAITLANCTFTELGGNGLMMMGYNSRNTIADSEFVWLGDSAIALVGRTNVVGGLVSGCGPGGDHPAWHPCSASLHYPLHWHILFPTRLSASPHHSRTRFITAIRDSSQPYAIHHSHTPFIAALYWLLFALRIGERRRHQWRLSSR